MHFYGEFIDDFYKRLTEILEHILDLPDVFGDSTVPFFSSNINTLLIVDYVFPNLILFWLH
ncbi:hypothetical protein PsorP6_011393 [Peronosclerospora sorghi]|uniref:Uncharacterized protein n=1 Tax=Peronosclerospora sorghi TaxID=230839 RepID=A0ACC0WJH8_9STRA|nr:hypothetical protein PsorP6_011393 [Peronosclerospora sorghi]